MRLYQHIIKLRQANNLSQEYIANNIGVSRPTYNQIEKGNRELTIPEAEKLAAIFSIPLEKFLALSQPEKHDIEIIKAKKKNNQADSIRIDIPQEKIEKFKEVLIYILEKVGARSNVGQTVLYKLLYFIDFDYYEKYEEQLMGIKYIKNHYGPTPVTFKKVVDTMQAHNEVEEIKSKYFQYDQKKYLPLRKANLNLLSAQEIKHIDEVLDRLGNKSAKELSEYSHQDTPWRVCENGEVLSYESVFYRDSDHSVKEYEDEL